jgi:predicted kinase
VAGKLIIMVGIPGSGKSTVAKRVVEKGFRYFNADQIRAELHGDEIIQGDHKQTYAILFERMEEAMKEGVSIVVDNTNLNPKQRLLILDRAKTFNYTDVQLWFLDVPLELCLERNKNRARVVPDDVITGMYNEFIKNGRPKRSEGKVVIIKPAPGGDDYLFFPQS